MEMMKRNTLILFLENEFIGRNSSGGVMTYMNNLTSYYDQKGINYKWITCAADSNTNTHIVKIANKPISNVKYVLLLFLWAARNKITPDTIIHSNRADYLLPFIFFHKAVKKVCTVHGMHDFCFSMKKGKALGSIYSLVYKFCIRHMDKIISVDDRTTAMYIDKYALRNGVISTIPIGVNFEQFRPIDKAEAKASLGLSQEVKYIVYIGRLEYEKNLMFLLESFDKLAVSVGSLCLLIIGSGSWKERLQEKAKAITTGDIRFINEVDYSSIPFWINASELLVLCSLYEGSPTVIREALACNTPVVTLDVGDVRQVFASISDEFICGRDTSEFANKMNEILGKAPQDYRKLIANYSADVMGARTLYSGLAF